MCPLTRVAASSLEAISKMSIATWHFGKRAQAQIRVQSVYLRVFPTPKRLPISYNRRYRLPTHIHSRTSLFLHKERATLGIESLRVGRYMVASPTLTKVSSAGYKTPKSKPLFMDSRGQLPLLNERELKYSTHK